MVELPAVLFKITNLSLEECDVDDRIFQQIGHLSNLSNLSLARTKVTAKGLQYISHHPVAYLGLHETLVNDNALEEISQLKSLKHLLLHKTNISVSGLRHLGKVNTLKKT